LIDEYELDGIGAEMEALWTSDSDRRKSLRELAELFNHRLLKTAMAEAGMETLDGEVQNVYRLLTDEEVRQADRMRARRRLERERIDVDDVLDDFVTYQAIRSYLKRTRGAEYTRTDQDPLEREAENLQQLQGWVASVSQEKLERLRNSDRLELGSFRTLVDISVVCEDCGTRYLVTKLLEREKCDCG
jgi:hypothetical protein